MLILIALLIASTASHRVTESVEDLPPEAFNTTTLFPVGNRTNVSDAGKASQQKTKLAETTTWKLEAAFGESQLDEKESNQDGKGTSTSPVPPPQNQTKIFSDGFKPSPHLGSFIGDYSIEFTPTKASLGEFRPLKKPPSAFVSFPKDNFKASLYHPPKEVFRQNQFPYKLEPSVHGKLPWPADLESRPTVEAPMRLPAGSLYKAPDPFKDKPVTDDEDFGLTFDDLKENNNVDYKKRVSPWKSLLRLMTAFIPVGLIISALTPNIITVQSTGPGIDHGYPAPNLFRRSDKPSELSAISEPCRRRLLCELHSENNYQQSGQTRGRRRHCFRIHCEEPEALAKMLHWILNHRPPNHRGRHDTEHT